LRAAKLTDRSEIICPTCGKQFSRSPSQIKSKHEGVYCSRECHYAGRASGLTKRIVTAPYRLVSDYDRSAASRKTWQTRRNAGKDRHSEATKERLRQATIAHISRNAEGLHVSELENKVAEELTRMGIAFTRQRPIRDPRTGRFVGVVDFWIDDRIALEINGTFWHADPRLFPGGPAFSSQRRTCERYARKVAALNRLGVPLVEAWEADLEQGFVDTLRNALAGLATG
jgi:G:T-mismatch repair DNA endonuclease (very short patch repair protein)